MGAQEAMIRVKDLHKRYAGKAAVQGVSFDVYPGEVFGLLGPNGAGKTTTMEMIEGLREIDQGEVEIDQLSVRKQVKQIRPKIGIQLQATSLFDLLTVEETLQLYASFYQQTKQIGQILEQMNLTEKRKELVKHLSGGQKQRLAIGLALIHDPKVVCLDEPTTGLDPQARRALWDIILDLKREGKTILLSTHYMEEAYMLCDRLAIMDEGIIIAMNTPDQLIADLEMDSAIQFYWPDESFPHEELSGVTRVWRVKDQVILYTDHLQITLVSLIRWADHHQYELSQLQTRKATLEDVFLQLTGRSLRES